MYSVADALTTVLARVPRLPAEDVPLARARGRVLAADVRAARPLPGFDNAAMDGYAVRAADVPGTLPVAAVAAAGGPVDTPIPARAAARIFTGAPLPPGLDAVIMQEDARADGGAVTLPAARPGDHVRRAGEDVAPGDVVLRAGTTLTAWHLALLAALGEATARVARAPRVAVLATGDELVDVATPPGPGQLVDSSAHALAALVEEVGGIPTYLGIARDDLGALGERLAAAAGHDVLLTTGGVSVGDRDHVRPALAAAGIELALYKVAMKPGKPFTLGLRDGVAAVFGLPGNPVSTLVGFELFVRPALRAMQGALVVERPRAPVALAPGYRKAAGRAHYLRAAVHREGARLVAHPHPKQGSAMLSSLVGCNALVELAAELTDIPPGADVPALLLEAV